MNIETEILDETEMVIEISERFAISRCDYEEVKQKIKEFERILQEYRI